MSERIKTENIGQFMPNNLNRIKIFHIRKLKWRTKLQTHTKQAHEALITVRSMVEHGPAFPNMLYEQSNVMFEQ